MPGIPQAGSNAAFIEEGVCGSPFNAACPPTPVLLLLLFLLLVFFPVSFAAHLVRCSCTCTRCSFERSVPSRTCAPGSPSGRRLSRAGRRRRTTRRRCSGRQPPPFLATPTNPQRPRRRPIRTISIYLYPSSSCSREKSTKRPVFVTLFFWFCLCLCLFNNQAAVKWRLSRLVEAGSRAVRSTATTTK